MRPPVGGRFSLAPPFVKLHRIHVHQPLNTVPSFVRVADSHMARFNVPKVGPA
jgi:hypothetical protein